MILIILFANRARAVRIHSHDDDPVEDVGGDEPLGYRRHVCHFLDSLGG